MHFEYEYILEVFLEKLIIKNLFDSNFMKYF